MMCMEYALLQKNAVHNLTTWKSAYDGNASKANKTNYISLLHHQLTFCIVMFKNKSLYLKCVFYFTIICGLGCGSMGRLGGEVYSPQPLMGIFKKILYAH